MSDDEPAISYRVLEPGTRVVTSDGVELGTVAEVLENRLEDIFDGLVVDTPAGRRFVDAPEVARITASVVTLTIDGTQAAGLPERDPAGGPEFSANTSAGRFRRPWRRR